MLSASHQKREWELKQMGSQAVVLSLTLSDDRAGGEPVDLFCEWT